MVLAGSSVTGACVAVRFGHRPAANVIGKGGHARSGTAQLNKHSLTIIPSGRKHENETRVVSDGRRRTGDVDRRNDATGGRACSIGPCAIGDDRRR